MTVYYLIFVILYGLVIGSFLNVCICRIPKGESIVKPPSHCTSCGKRLGLPDLVPVFSYVFLRSRCRHCKAKVSIRYPLVELLTAAVYVLLFYRYSLSVEFLAAAFLMSVLIAVFFIDIDHRIIPDRLVLTALAGGAVLMVYNIFQPVGLYTDRQWWNPLAGIGAGSGTLFLVALIGMLVYKSDDAMGMGDVKIFAPIGMFLGWKLTFIALLAAIFIAAAASIILIVLRLKDRKGTIPFGPFIVTGAFIALLWGADILNWYMNI